ncbi:14204_t:CDS:2 [Funneliformis geosporum]|nr:14204_t:CDS:2 [Funneliformis geosporum]
MRIWQQNSSTKFVSQMSEGNYCHHQHCEILNFARPGTPTDSLTAAMTAERRKLRELPRLSINTDITLNSHPAKKSPHQVDEVKVTRDTPHVKFAEKNHRRTKTEVKITADLDVESNESKRDDNEKFENDKKKKQRCNAKQLKAYRRASAPAKGMDYYFKNTKQTKENLVAINYFSNSNTVPEVNESEHSIPTVHVQDYNEKNNQDMNNDNRKMSIMSMSSSITSISSIISPCDPPSLSPCSSTSSLNSSIDMLSPAIAKQQNFPQNFNPWPIKSRSKSISNEEILFKTESRSLPDIVPYDANTPWSPAAMFLSNFAHSAKQPMPDEEGQQVGEYIIGKVIGRGGFSTVKQAYTMDSYSGSMETVAVKIIRNYHGSQDDDRVQYCPGGTLLQYIKTHGLCEGKGLDEDEARNIFLEIAESIRYLHNDMRLVHKDIKLDNILLDKDDTWRICDFGLTEFQNEENGFNNILYSDIVGGSLAYCAPEQLRSPTPLKDASVDIWSLGVVLFAMITGQLPFSDSFQPRLQLKILNGRYDESMLDVAVASDELKDLLKGMFKTKPQQRLTISQILEHQWCER